MSRSSEAWHAGSDDLPDIDKIEHPGLRKLLGVLEKVRQARSDKADLLLNLTACCPAHPDTQPSLSVGWWKNGRVSVHCHAGCSRDEVLRAAGVSKDEVAPPRAKQNRASIVATYDYVSEDGTLLYQACRKSPKSFHVRRPDGKGGWIPNLGDVTRVLYRLRQLVRGVEAGETIFICEGEKDVDRLASLGFVATCNQGGAGKWRKEYSAFLRGANVVVVEDNDAAGESHTKSIVASLQGAAASIKVVRFTDLPPKSDISDWLDLGHTVDELRALVASLPVVAGGAAVVPNSWEAMDPDRPQLAEDEQGIWLLTHEGRKRLTNFRARITADVVEVDGAEGARTFEITASIGDRPSRTFRIRAAEYFEMKWHLVHIGADAAVMPNAQVGSARYAIQVLSFPVPRRTIYLHTGWQESESGDFIFLHAGGAIGAHGVVEDVEVTIGGPLSGYVLPRPPLGGDERSAVVAAFSLLDGLAPDRIVWPLFAAVWRAVLGGADFAIHLAGRTGVFKSELAALAQQHFGSGLDARHLPAAWSGTANALEGIAFLAKDVILVIDDFCPRGARNEVDSLNRLADRVLRAQGNASGRARMNQDITLRQNRPPRGVIISTGEDVPSGQSLAARVLIIEVGKGDVNLDALTVQQILAADGRLAEFMSGYVRFLAARMKDLRSRQQAEFRQLRQRAIAVAAHSRTPGIVANLMLGVRRVVAYACSVGVLDTAGGVAFEERAWAALVDAGKQQANYQSEDSPAVIFVRGIVSALASGSAYLSDKDGGRPAQAAQCGWVLDESERSEAWRPRGPRIGFIEGDDVYLFPDPAYAAAQRMTETSSARLAVRGARLHRTLWEENLLKSRGQRGSQPYFQTRARLEGRRIYVLHFDVRTFGLRADGASSGDVDQEAI